MENNIIKTNEEVKDSNRDTYQVDFLIKMIGDIEYKFELKYKNLKYLKARFNLSMIDFDKFHEYVGEILYSSISSKNGDEGKRGDFNKFEESLNSVTIEYLFEIVEELLAISFPNKFGEIKKDEEFQNENTKKK